MNRQHRYMFIVITSAAGIVLNVALLGIGSDAENYLLRTFTYFLTYSFYMLMIMLWGLSAMHRIMQPEIRFNLVSIAICMQVWLFLREIKWHMAPDSTWSRYLWYAYYIPMILIPLFGFNAARCIGRSEYSRSSWKWHYFYSISLALISMVMSNDLHGFVFDIPNLSWPDEYTRGPGYFLIAAWVLSLEVAMIAVMISRTRTSSGAKTLAPIALVIMGIVYAFAYISPSSHSFAAQIDLMPMFCWLTVMMWETCDEVGLIPSNSNYTQFFANSTIGAQIVDEDGKAYISAQNAVRLSPAIFKELKKTGARMYNMGTELHLVPINCGYMIWQENIRTIHSMIEEMEQNQRELKEGNILAEEEMKASVRREKIAASNRIYSLLAEEMQESLGKITILSSEMLREHTAMEEQDLLRQMNILGIYIKRKSNFVMLAETSPDISPKEIKLTLDEYARNLRVCGIELIYRFEMKQICTKENVLVALDFLNEIFENSLFTAEIIKVHIFDDNSPRIETKITYRDGTQRVLSLGGEA